METLVASEAKVWEATLFNELNLFCCTEFYINTFHEFNYFILYLPMCNINDEKIKLYMLIIVYDIDVNLLIPKLKFKYSQKK